MKILWNNSTVRGRSSLDYLSARTHWGNVNSSSVCITAILLRSRAVRPWNNHQQNIRGYQGTKQYALCYETRISLPPSTHTTHTHTHTQVCLWLCRNVRFKCDACPKIRRHAEMPRLDLKNEMKTIGAPQRVLCLRLNLFLCPLMLHLESVGGRTGGLPSSLTHSLTQRGLFGVYWVF